MPHSLAAGLGTVAGCQAGPGGLSAPHPCPTPRLASVSTLVAGVTRVAFTQRHSMRCPPVFTRSVQPLPLAPRFHEAGLDAVRQPGLQP